MIPIRNIASLTGFLSVLIAGLLSASSVRADTRPRPGSNYRIERSSADEVIVTVMPKTYEERTIVVAGRMMKRFDAALSVSTTEPGKPEMPLEGFLVAVPPGRSPYLEVLESKFDVAASDEIAPAPFNTYSAEGEAIPEYRIDRDFYERSNGFYPLTAVELGGTAQLRDLRVAKIAVHPLQYNPVTRQLKKLSHLKLRVRFLETKGGGSDRQSLASGPDPYFEGVYRNLILNYEQAGSWRTIPASPGRSDTTGRWFQTGRPYYRLPVIADGLYRLSDGFLLSYGVDLSAMNNASAAVYYKGQSLPIRVSTSDADPQKWYIEFFAHRNYGASSYFDRYNDTSSYWLTWNDPHPVRMPSDTVTAAGTTDTLRWSLATVHVERDSNYFSGVTVDDVANVEDVPGEGWYWYDFFSSQSRSIPFTIDSVQRMTGSPVTVRARLYGMTTCSGGSCKPPSRHNAKFLINNSLIGEANWTDNTECIFTGALPDSILKAGSNSLKVTSKSWTAADSNISKFYLDWFEVSYPKPLLVAGGSLKFTSPSAAGPDTTTFIVNGSPADSTTVVDLTSGRTISNLKPLGLETFSFADTASGPKDYLVVTESGRSVPLPLRQKTFSNLRVNTRGADYIIITHALFRSGAEILAQHRASVNRLRTAVVDVQDIFDEFNYGHVLPVAIRDFLKRAYYSWKRPSPVYVTMFGDASWDPKHNLSNTIKENYVPAYGSPPSDNAFVCFDSLRNYIPFMLIGRIPVENSGEVSSVISKIIAYDAPPVSSWNKAFLFITGGTSPSEKATFNYWSDDLINRYVTRYPVGGTVSKIYKATDGIVDGENRQTIENIIRNGIVFLNFIGHSSGRIWSVDAGKPTELQNTNGQLPFIVSVSCNVGAFATHYANVLSEDYLMADNRGAIAVWASSTAASGPVGRALVDKLLATAQANYGRSLGLLTTVARINYWAATGSATPLVIQALQLNPLIGDPFTEIALPLSPDLSVTGSDIALTTPTPTADSTVTIRATIQNLGLMTGTAIPATLTDSYTDETGRYRGESDVISPFTIPDFAQQYHLSIPWNVKGKAGSHTLTLSLDPRDTLGEPERGNNTAQTVLYIYRNTISAVKPPACGIIRSATPELVVTTPSGRDTTPLSYVFEIDTLQDFSGPGKIVSGSLPPGKTSAIWRTPALLPDRPYYWHGRSSDGAKNGAWAGSSFIVSSAAPQADTTEFYQSKAQLAFSTLRGAGLTADGATLTRLDSARLYVLSLGSRADEFRDYFSIVQVNGIRGVGAWWEDCWSYLVARYNPVDGSYKIKGYNLLQVGEVDSMTAFIDQTPSGTYLLLSVVRDGKQNLTEALYQRIEQLGSTSIRSVASGGSWAIISRKGEAHPAFEDIQPTGIVEGTVVLPNNYHGGKGEVLTAPIGPASRWLAVSWTADTPANSAASLRVLGIRANNAVDTLATLPGGTSGADLSGLDPAVYGKLMLSGNLLSLDGAVSPTLRSWKVTYLPTADLAVSAWTFKASPESLQSGSPVGLSLDVYNDGYEAADSPRVSFFLLEDTTDRIDLTAGSIPPGGVEHISTQLVVSGSPGPHTITALVRPNAGLNDLLQENNTASLPIFITPGKTILEKVKLFFDGLEIQDGDYVRPRPTVTLQLSGRASGGALNLRILLDGREVARPALPSATGPATAEERPITILSHDTLADGGHTIEVLSLASSQTLQSLGKSTFQVLAESKLLEVFNYPNPFSGQTAFTFKLTGSELPEEVRIKIFTVAGRLILDFPIEQGRLRIGFNHFTWTGRDQDGDDVANGTYFYKVVMKTSSAVSEEIQKLVRLR